MTNTIDRFTQAVENAFGAPRRNFCAEDAAFDANRSATGEEYTVVAGPPTSRLSLLAGAR